MQGGPYEKELAEEVYRRFCPQCGEAIVPNHRGRPKVFCSDRCRYLWKNTHPQPGNWASTREVICPVCGKNFLAFREYDKLRKYCSRACANRGRKKVVAGVSAELNAVSVQKGGEPDGS